MFTYICAKILLQPRERVNDMEGNKICETPEEVYASWKSSLAKHGQTPTEMVLFFRDKGMTEYADDLESFISRMEGLR